MAELRTLTAAEVLALPMGDNDSGASTVGGYLAELLARVITDGEGFDGKRPFGNSGWDSELMIPLVKAGVIEGTFDEDGYLDDADYSAGENILIGALEVLGGRQKPTTGEVAYSGYYVACGGKSLISGAELPSWDEQSEEIRAAWQATADAVLRTI